MKRTALVYVLALGALAAPAWADNGDAIRGKAYATSMCGGCHAIAADATSSPNPAAKPLREIALPDATGEGFAKWMNTQHPPAHSSLLKPGQAADIAAFIATLKTPGG